MSIATALLVGAVLGLLTFFLWLKPRIDRWSDRTRPKAEAAGERAGAKVAEVLSDRSQAAENLKARLETPCCEVFADAGRTATMTIMLSGRWKEPHSADCPEAQRVDVRRHA